jgi:hypothetical protein
MTVNYRSNGAIDSFDQQARVTVGRCNKLTAAGEIL